MAQSPKCLLIIIQGRKRTIPSSGMLHRVALIKTEISEESIASIIRMTEIGELRKTSAVASNRSILPNKY
jgi:hypothetical protein